MRAFGAALCAIALGACASAPAPASDVTRISYQISSWGYVQERWTIASSGEATFERTPSRAQLGTPLQPTQTFTLTPADFERIRSTLEPTERFAAGGLPCEVQMTDAPYGTLTWQNAGGGEREVRFYTACRETRDLTLFFTKVTDADRDFHRLTATSEE